MVAQLGVSLVTRLALTLQRQLKVIRMTLKESPPLDRESVSRLPTTRLFDPNVNITQRVPKVNGVVTRDSMCPGDAPGLSPVPEDVPMQHLFLLDMKIGR